MVYNRDDDKYLYYTEAYCCDHVVVVCIILLFAKKLGQNNECNHRVNNVLRTRGATATPSAIPLTKKLRSEVLCVGRKLQSNYYLDSLCHSHGNY